MTIQGKHIVILGAGESGTGAAILAKKQGATVFVSEKQSITSHYKTVLQDLDIPFEEGGHSIDQLFKADAIVKSPGIPFSIPLIKQIVDYGIQVMDEIEFAYAFSVELKHQHIAVSGTNGKTTTATMIHHLLSIKEDSVDLVGNIGRSFASSLANSNFKNFVLELSSFQMEGCEQFAPSIYVLTNITPDHLDRYDGSLDKYAAAKIKIIQHMDEHSTLILNGDDNFLNELVDQKVRPFYKGKILKFGFANENYDAFVSDKYLNFKVENRTLKLPLKDLPIGPHQQLNMMAAVLSALIYWNNNTTSSSSENDIYERLKMFEAIPHRMQKVKSMNGIDFINDSKATNVESSAFALRSFAPSIIWIVGGYDKGNDYHPIETLVSEKVKVIICLGVDNSKIISAFEGIEIIETRSMKDAINLAYSSAKEGDTILLSPACASFDLFKNYEDRGEQFIEFVHALNKEINSDQTTER